jgi:hypothetical protein
MRVVLLVVVGAFVALLVLGSLDGGGTWPHTLQYDARERVRATLRDPASAEFRNLRVHPGPTEDSKAVCGEFNARNGFGGMSGWQRFIVVARRSAENNVLTAPALLQEQFRQSWPELEARHCVR